MKIAIVIPTYNSELYIEKTLDSVLTQSEKVDRIILIDDCSKDNTVNLVKTYINNYKNIELICLDKNLGPAGIRNYALKYVDEDFVMFLDHDDIIDFSLIKKYKDSLGNASNVTFVYCNAVQIDMNDNVISAPVIYNFENKNDILGDFIVRNRILSMTGILINTNKLKEIEGFDHNLIYSQDWDLWLRLINKGEIIHINETLIRIRRHSNNTSRDINNFLKDELTVYNKYSLEFLKNNILLRSFHTEDNIIDYVSVLFKLSFFDEAYNELIKLSEGYKKYFYLGLYNLEKGRDYAKAKDCFKSSFKLDNSCIEALNNLGVCYFYLEEKVKAKDCFQRASNYNKEYMDAKNNLENVKSGNFTIKLTKRMLRKVLTRYEN